MNWVKASERLPSKKGSYFAREIKTGYKGVLWYSQSGNGFLKTRSFNYEWLDEDIPSVDLGDKGQTFFAR